MSEPITSPEPDRPSAEPMPEHRIPTTTVVTVAVLLIVPVLALLLVPTYAKEGPHLLGFPFFYWWQLLWMFVEAGMVYAAYRLLEHARSER